TVSILDGAHAPSKVTVGNDAGAPALTVNHGRVFVVNTADRTVSILDCRTTCHPAGTLPVGRQTNAHIATDGTFVYVANTLDDTATVTDARTPGPTSPAPGGPTPPGTARAETSYAAGGGAPACSSPSPPPQAPANVHAEVHGTRAEVSWEAPTDGRLPIV